MVFTSRFFNGENTIHQREKIPHVRVLLLKSYWFYFRFFSSYDCDEFTRHYYFKMFGVKEMDPIDVSTPKARASATSRTFPPYNGFGSPDDSLQNCLSLIPQPPKKDFIKILENDGKILRFSAVMVQIEKPENCRMLAGPFLGFISA